MKANRVLNRKKENENKRKEDATEAISIMTNKSVQINFDYSKLQDINEEEKAKLMEIEKEIIFEVWENNIIKNNFQIDDT